MPIKSKVRVKRGISDEVEAYTKLMNDGIKAGLHVEHLDWVWLWYKKNYYLDGRFKISFIRKQAERKTTLPSKKR